MVLAHHVQEGVLQAGEGLFAGVFTCGGGTHGHGGHIVLIFLADSAVGAAHGLIDLGRERHGKDSGLHHDGTLAELIDALRRGSEAFNHVIDERAQLRGTGLGAVFLGVSHAFAELMHKFLQIIGILVDHRVVPVDAAVFLIHHAADEAAVDFGLIENVMEGNRGDGSEMRSLDFLNLTDDGGVVVFAADQHFAAGTQLDDIRTCQHKLFPDILRRLRGLFLVHDFLRFAGHMCRNQ